MGWHLGILHRSGIVPSAGEVAPASGIHLLEGGGGGERGEEEEEEEEEAEEEEALFPSLNSLNLFI